MIHGYTGLFASNVPTAVTCNVPPPRRPGLPLDGEITCVAPGPGASFQIALSVCAEAPRPGYSSRPARTGHQALYQQQIPWVVLAVRYIPPQFPPSFFPSNSN